MPRLHIETPKPGDLRPRPAPTAARDDFILAARYGLLLAAAPREDEDYHRGFADGWRSRDNQARMVRWADHGRAAGPRLTGATGLALLIAALFGAALGLWL